MAKSHRDDLNHSVLRASTCTFEYQNLTYLGQKYIMASFFYSTTKAFTNLAINEPSPKNNEPKPNVNPNFPDCSTSEYTSLGRDFRFFPEVHKQPRPNFIPRSNAKSSTTYGRVPGRHYPSGTSEQLYTVGEHKRVEKVGPVQRQMTVGRWRVICNNEECLEDHAEGFWEKIWQIDMDTNQITCSTKFMGRCNLCGRIFHEHVDGI
ncbi:hypothetical protein E4T50_04417 [Aureobasidium sp. EXF-12298]|nr:hypothetical protein E4T50_04417 [Aureobasidium sp. EXF-12298]KAI4760342.1 hypothetical protein E4T51_06649 [Aureobasidium sp. EXF-12344]KAI4781018.1 hypothetical protein E4T52_04100 [Aureobasidium sp. EXF-3400]